MPPSTHEDITVDWSETTVSRLKSAKQARPMWLIRTFVLKPDESCAAVTTGPETYSFEIPVDYPLFMHIDQPPGDVSELQ